MPVFYDFYEDAHQLKGLENFEQFFTMLIKGFLDFQFIVEDMIAEGDKVWVRFRETGTHTADYLGLTPTGKKGCRNSRALGINFQ